jgi:hypothetical protein
VVYFVAPCRARHKQQQCYYGYVSVSMHRSVYAPYDTVIKNLVA